MEAAGRNSSPPLVEAKHLILSELQDLLVEKVLVEDSVSGSVSRT